MRKALELGETEIQREIIRAKMAEKKQKMLEIAHRNEVEKEIHKKMKNKKYFKKQKDEDGEDDGKPIIRRAALIDKIKFKNMPMKSYAVKKRAWKGDYGMYRIKDLASWFKLYDDTKLLAIKNDLKKD